MRKSLENKSLFSYVEVKSLNYEGIMRALPFLIGTSAVLLPGCVVKEEYHHHPHDLVIVEPAERIEVEEHHYHHHHHEGEIEEKVEIK